MRQQEMGYAQTPGQKYVCPDCIADEHLRRDVEHALEQEECSYCGAAGAADLTIVFDSVSEVIACDYTDPANVLLYDSREGGYQGVVYDGHELVWDLYDHLGTDKLVEDVADAFTLSAWCEREYLRLSDHDRLRYGWEGFVDEVLHRSRFLFLLNQGDTDDFDAPVPPSRLLSEVGGLLREFDTFRLLKAGVELFRARVHCSDEKPSTAEELGSPPIDKTTANRMSPVGISMFYAALDEETALAETFDPARAEGKAVTSAVFRPKRDLVMLDLTKLPLIPSPFDRERRHLRWQLLFLHGFAADLVQPIARDGRERLAYVPTQVVTEYVRHVLTTVADVSVDGILYSSSRVEDGTALVIFADSEQCGPREATGFPRAEVLLDLVSHSLLEGPAT